MEIMPLRIGLPFVPPIARLPGQQFSFLNPQAAQISPRGSDQKLVRRFLHHLSRDRHWMRVIANARDAGRRLRAEHDRAIERDIAIGIRRPPIPTLSTSGSDSTAMQPCSTASIELPPPPTRQPAALAIVPKDHVERMIGKPCHEATHWSLPDCARQVPIVPA